MTRLTRSSKLREITASQLSKLGAILSMNDKWRDFAVILKNRSGQPKFEDYQLYQLGEKPQPGEHVLRCMFADNVTLGEVVDLFLQIDLVRVANIILVDILEEKPFETPTPTPTPTDNEEHDTSWKENVVLTTGNPYEFQSYQLSQITNGFCADCFIAKGGFGEVFKGTLKSHTLAVKRFLPQTGIDQQKLVAKQFSNEMEILKSLKHMNILPIYGYCMETPCYTVYPFISGGSLEDRLACKNDRAPIPGWDRIPILRGVTSGIQYLHTSRPCNPLVHTDIKSANILLDENLAPKLCDFGLVRSMMITQTGSATCRTEGMLVGSPGYIPPECTEGFISPKWDIFSFGVVILEVLTGQKAWDGDQEILSLKVRWEKVDDTNELLDEKGEPWPEATVACLTELADQCLQLNRRDRPAIDKVVEQLEHVKCMSDA